MKYHNITKDDMLNGDGLRVVLWVSGCEHHCHGCQNPVTWNPDDGLYFDQESKEELFAELEKPYVSGITFSGGDPLYFTNIEKVTELCREVKKNFPSKSIWIYTGYSWDEVKHLTALMKYVDVLVDGKFIKELADKNLKWKGSSNQRVIDVQESLKEKKVILYESN